MVTQLDQGGETRRLAAEDHLRRIQTLTDSALAHLDLDDLLDELLDRIRELLRADTAAILLLDPSRRELVATAAKGIEEEVRQGVRIPVGGGFAGRIAATRAPLILDEVDHTNVLNPILREKGIRSLLGAPLVSGGEVMGVVHVGTLHPRHFTDDDINLLQVVGDRAAVSISAHLSKQERSMTATLQRSLLPGRLPAIQGVIFGARYVPGETGLGGDWYDVLPLSRDRVGIVIGDVVGHGLLSSVVMGRFRSALRAYAIDAPNPAQALTRLNAMVRVLEPREMATVLYGVFNRATGVLEFSSAGHPPPVLALPDRRGELLEAPSDPPIGAPEPRSRRLHTVTVPVGSTLYLYTDGVVERRGHSIDDGLDALCDAAQAGSPELGCARITGRLLGNIAPDDDFALLAMHRTGVEETFILCVPAVAAALSGIRAEVRRWLRDQGVAEDDVFELIVAIGEACANAVEHAYGAAEGEIVIEAELDGPDVVVTVADTGSWRPARGQNRGRGLLMMRRLMDDVEVRQEGRGTQVILRRQLGRIGER